MTTVFDGSALVAALADTGPDGQWADSLLATDVLVAPELLLAETTNILRRLERAGALSALDASAAQQDILRLDIELFPFAPFADRVWALRHNLTAYDAWYVAIAEEVDGRLATLDRRLSRANGPRCQVVVPPATSPDGVT